MKRNKGTPFPKAPLSLIVTVTNIFLAYRETKLKKMKHYNSSQRYLFELYFPSGMFSLFIRKVLKKKFPPPEY